LIVVDASALVDLLLLRAGASNVAGHLRTHRRDLHAPHLLDVEVVHALRTSVARRALAPERADAALDDFEGLDIHRYPHGALLRRAWGLRANMTAYDATYVTLAEALGSALLTADRRLASAVRAHTGVPVLLA
jgi:predicted nucleic acid-binding protein